MKNLLLLVALFFVSVVSTNNSFAAVGPALTANTTAIAAATPATTLSKKQLKKQAKKQARMERKMARKAKFASFMAKIAGSSNQIVAIILAYFVGWLGIHRVYMGAKPIIILWFVLSLGGFFGLMPIIDFFRLIFGGTDHYEGNDEFFATFKS